MKPRFRKKGRYETTAGTSLAEISVVIVIMALVVGGLYKYFSITQKATAHQEALITLKSESQKTVNKIHFQLDQAMRVFQDGDAVSASFLANFDRGPLPAPLTGSKLPRVQESGTFSLTSASFAPGSVGNELFFVALDASRDIQAGLLNARIDVYRFHYYGLTQDPSVALLKGFPALNLWEWRSEPLADYNGITVYTGVTQSSIVSALVANGITYAWDSTATSPNLAFYRLDSMGSITLDPGHALRCDYAKMLSKALTSLTLGGFFLGVCPNTALIQDFAPSTVVPQYATADGVFPSGFEVMAIGSPSQRQILIRLVYAAVGTFPGVLTNEVASISTVRDF